jgi:hypothetical protein
MPQQKEIHVSPSSGGACIKLDTCIGGGFMQKEQPETKLDGRGR